jgi:hypothetical protein
MTTDSGSQAGPEPSWRPGRSVLPPDEILAEMDRVAERKAKAKQVFARQRARRRVLPAVMVGSALIVTAGLADRFVQSTLPTAQATGTVAGRGTSTGAASTPSGAALEQVARALAADERTIAAIAQAQAALSRTSGDDGGEQGGLPPIALPKLPNVPNMPSISVPSIPAAPATHATTGASVVVP